MTDASAPEPFVIAWLNPANTVCYLVDNGLGGVHATETMADATTWPSHAEGWAVFLQWAPSLQAHEGAVLHPSEVQAQFDAETPNPRPCFTLSREGVASAITQIQDIAAQDVKSLRDALNASQMQESVTQTRLSEALERLAQLERSD